MTTFFLQPGSVSDADRCAITMAGNLAVETHDPKMWGMIVADPPKETMTRRDQFVLGIVQGMLTNSTIVQGDEPMEDIVPMAVKLADRILAELERKESDESQ